MFIPMWLIVVVLAYIVFGLFANASFRTEVRTSLSAIQQGMNKSPVADYDFSYDLRQIKMAIEDVKSPLESQMDSITDEINNLSDDILRLQSEVINVKWHTSLDYPELIAQSGMIKDMFYDLYSKLIWIEHYTTQIYDQTEEGQEPADSQASTDLVKALRHDIDSAMKEHVTEYDRQRDSMAEIVKEHLLGKKAEDKDE